VDDTQVDYSDGSHLRWLVSFNCREVENDEPSVAALDRGLGLEGGVGHVGRIHA